MPNILDKLRTALKRTTSTTDQLAAALADARQADADAREAVERQVLVVASTYLDPAATRAAARAKLADLRTEAEDASLILAEAERQHSAAVAADDDARRRAVYDGAKAEAAAAAADLAKLYPRLAYDLVALMARVAKAQQYVAAANAELPAGAVPLADPEAMARHSAGLPREIINERQEVLWVHDLEQSPIRPASPERQREIVDYGHGWGFVPADGPVQGMSAPQVPYFRRHRLLRREFREAGPAVALPPLAAQIHLPALTSSTPLWEGAEHWREVEPAEVLARADAVEAAAVAPPEKVRREVKVEWDDLGETEPRPMIAPDPTDTARHTPPTRPTHFGASPFGLPGRAAGGRR